MDKTLQHSDISNLLRSTRFLAVLGLFGPLGRRDGYFRTRHVFDSMVVRFFSPQVNVLQNFCPSTVLPDRMREQGAPSMYSCYQDESLNIALREVAQHAHRTTFPTRVHQFLDLQASLLDSSCLATARQWLPLVSGSAYRS